MSDDPRIVKVNSAGGGAQRALGEPRFVVQTEDGKMYMTMAVLEYDPGSDGKTDDQSRDIQSLQGIVADSPACGKVVRLEAAAAQPQPMAAQMTAGIGTTKSFLTTSGAVSFAQTDPPPDR